VSTTGHSFGARRIAVFLIRWFYWPFYGFRYFLLLLAFSSFNSSFSRFGSHFFAYRCLAYEAYGLETALPSFWRTESLVLFCYFLDIDIFYLFDFWVF